MARQYSIFPKPLLMVVLFVVGYLGGGSSLDYCGKTPPTHPADFPWYVDSVLHDLVAYTQAQTADPSTGETTYTLTNPKDSVAGSGAANGTASCFSGYAGDDCGNCLKKLQAYVGPCRNVTTGAAHYKEMCSLDFYQL